MTRFVAPVEVALLGFALSLPAADEKKITNEHQQSKDENLDSATYHFSILHPPSAEVSSYPFFFA